MSGEIPIIDYDETPHEDPTWTSLYGNLLHPDFAHPVFFRHNGTNLNLFNWYNGDTVYIVARGPSIGKVLEDKTLKAMLLHPAIVKFGMNTSPEILDNHVNLWAGVDKMQKFQSNIFKNPNIMKFVPMHRYQVVNYGTKCSVKDKAIAYKDSLERYTCHCANTVGVQTFLLQQHPKSQMSFGSAYLGSPAVLFGYYKGMKSVFLFVLKLCILLGFKRVVLLGVDFNMDKQNPYYLNSGSDYSGFHTDHNNKLYATLSPIIKEIHGLLESGESGYNVKIVTANPIATMPFIETINLKKELQQEINQKT